MKIFISTLCGEMLARKEDTIFPPLLKILSQHADVAGIPNTLRATTERSGNWSWRIFHQASKSNESKSFFEIKGVDKYKVISFFKASFSTGSDRESKSPPNNADNLDGFFLFPGQAAAEFPVPVGSVDWFDDEAAWG